MIPGENKYPRRKQFKSTGAQGNKCNGILQNKQHIRRTHRWESIAFLPSEASMKFVAWSTMGATNVPNIPSRMALIRAAFDARLSRPAEPQTVARWL